MMNLKIPADLDAVKADSEIILEIEELSARLAKAFIVESWDCLTEEDYDLCREKWEKIRLRWENFISEGETAN